MQMPCSPAEAPALPLQERPVQVETVSCRKMANCRYALVLSPAGVFTRAIGLNLALLMGKVALLVARLQHQLSSGFGYQIGRQPAISAVHFHMLCTQRWRTTS